MFLLYTYINKEKGIRLNNILNIELLKKLCLGKECRLKMSKIEEEKKMIDNILKLTKYNSINRAKAGLLSVLGGSLKKEEITEENYNELISYIEEKIEQIKNQQTTEEKIDNTKSLKQNSKERFEHRIKVMPEELNYVPIYKGKFNKIPPKSKDIEEK